MSEHASQLSSHVVHSIQIGGVYASSIPTVVRTVLGSCIAVCLYDEFTQIGGMNHFMLPHYDEMTGISTRYGLHAMELLINECMKSGADRRRLQAKVFGGGHVVRVQESDLSVPKQNIRFALSFLETERIPIVSRDLGGYEAREIYFYTDTGRTLLKRIDCHKVVDASIIRAEYEANEYAKKQIADTGADITLF